MGFSLDKKQLESEMDRIEKKFDRAGYVFDRTMTNALELMAEGILKRIQDKAPVDSEDLKKSIFYKVNPRGKQKTVTFYSNSPYFDVMDTGYSVDRIFPKPGKKALKIPADKARRLKRLSDKDRKNIKDHGGVFRRSVKTPEVDESSKKGPNMFYSGQINELVRGGQSELRKAVDEAFNRSFSGRGYEGL